MTQRRGERLTKSYQKQILPLHGVAIQGVQGPDPSRGHRQPRDLRKSKAFEASFDGLQPVLAACHCNFFLHWQINFFSSPLTAARSSL